MIFDNVQQKAALNYLEISHKDWDAKTPHKPQDIDKKCVHATKPSGVVCLLAAVTPFYLYQTA